MTAARVYLMADFGKGPRVVKREPDTIYHASWNPKDTAFGAHLARYVGSSSWWLVEAESADAARAIIGHATGDCACSVDGEAHAACRGRIIASGGAK